MDTCLSIIYFILSVGCSMSSTCVLIIYWYKYWYKGWAAVVGHRRKWGDGYCPHGDRHAEIHLEPAVFTVPNIKLSGSCGLFSRGSVLYLRISNARWVNDSIGVSGGNNNYWVSLTSNMCLQTFIKYKISTEKKNSRTYKYMKSIVNA